MAADDDRKKNGVIIVATFLEGVTHLLIYVLICFIYLQFFGHFTLNHTFVVSLL